MSIRNVKMMRLVAAAALFGTVAAPAAAQNGAMWVDGRMMSMEFASRCRSYELPLTMK